MDAVPSQMPAVQVNFVLEIGKGQMQVAAVVPKESVTLVQLLPALKQISSNIVNAISGAVHDEGYQISCKAGCAACCRQLVPLTLFEADELAQWVRSLPLDQQAILEQRFHEALVKLRASGILERLDFSKTPDPRSQAAFDLAMDYLRVGVACPFLVDESCGIYPIRPVICREYLVTSPAEFCAHPTRETVKPVPMPVRLSSALMHLGAEITTEKQGWMPLTFLFAWMKAKGNVADAYVGTGPELLRIVIERITVDDALTYAAQPTP